MSATAVVAAEDVTCRCAGFLASAAVLGFDALMFGPGEVVPAGWRSVGVDACGNRLFVRPQDWLSLALGRVR